MKNITHYVISFLAAGGLSLTAGAQDLSTNTRGTPDYDSIRVDSTSNQKMEADLHKRNSFASYQPVVWKEYSYGFNGTYSSNDVQYLARYDKNCNYVETLTKKEWNDNAPARLKAAYGKSPYKLQKVTGYWEGTDPGKKEYYLEFNDGRNNGSPMWVNEDGTFSVSPEGSGSH